MKTMFKKKNELPPWPKPPTNNQMLEDITSATNDDPVFTEFQRPKVENSDKSNVDAAYDLVKKFLNVNVRLEESMNNLQDKNEVLQKSSSELKNMADVIRQQAVNALK